MNMGQTTVIKTRDVFISQARRGYSTIDRWGNLPLTNLFSTPQRTRFGWVVKCFVNALFKTVERLTPLMAAGTCIAHKNAFAIMNYRHNSSCE